jgi:hypothetical protein
MLARLGAQARRLAPAALALLLVGAAVAGAAAKDAKAPQASIDTERTYYAQPGLVAAKVAALAGERPGVADLYFVGFAGTSTQDVFLKEVRFAQKLFDDRFDTRNRSLLLANNPSTLADLPVASVSNLRAALDGVAKKMNVDEDILFLFLTSHGSQHVFSVYFPELALDDLGDRELRQMLDAAGIKWRVIVISACYSGSFIDALKSDDTLVLTAASADRASFGCSSENDFTYFGDAYLNEALRQDRSFITAFEHARAAIVKRETKENLTPSQPQISAGKAIKAKLEQFEAHLPKPRAAAAQP